MSKRKHTIGTRAALVSSCFALLAYGCTAEPADGDDDGASGSGGSAGTLTGGATATGGTTATGGAAPTGGATAMGGTAPTGGATATGGTAPTGGATATGGTAPTGGATATGGTGGAGVTGGSAGSGTAGSGGSPGGVNTDPECSGIKSDGACTVMAKECPNLVCGLGDTGRRTCNCSATWSCTPCDFTGSPVATKPANADTPCVGAVDGMACATTPDSPDSVCRNGTDTAKPYCMCSTNPKAPADPPEWNCDKGPTGWPPPT